MGGLPPTGGRLRDSRGLGRNNGPIWYADPGIRIERRVAEEYERAGRKNARGGLGEVTPFNRFVPPLGLSTHVFDLGITPLPNLARSARGQKRRHSLDELVIFAPQPREP